MRPADRIATVPSAVVPRDRPQGNLPRPIVVVPSGRRAAGGLPVPGTADRGPPGRVRTAESGRGVRTPLDRSVGRTLMLAG